MLQLNNQAIYLHSMRSDSIVNLSPIAKAYGSMTKILVSGAVYTAFGLADPVKNTATRNAYRLCEYLLSAVVKSNPANYCCSATQASVIRLAYRFHGIDFILAFKLRRLDATGDWILGPVVFES